MAAAVRRAAKSAPQTNRMTGPNVMAAAFPTKNRPGTDDSNRPESRGAPCTVAIAARVDASTNSSESTLTRNPVPLAGYRTERAWLAADDPLPALIMTGRSARPMTAAMLDNWHDWRRQRAAKRHSRTGRAAVSGRPAALRGRR